MTAVADNVRAIGRLRRSGILEPGLSVANAAGMARWGATPAAVVAGAAGRYPTRVALVDEAGSLTYGELDRRTSRLAAGLVERGVTAEHTIGILARNHRGFVEANLAAAKIGADVVYLNTGFGAPQLADVLRREQVGTVVRDQEYAAIVEAATAEAAAVRLVLSSEDDPDDAGPPASLASVRAAARRSRPPRPRRASLPVLLTSGTTGTPKGARRDGARPDLVSATALLDRIPYRRGDVFVIAAPLFHAWGLSMMVLAASLAGTVVLRRRFDPVATVEAVERHDASVLAVVPVMLHRILSSGALDGRDVSSLRIVCSSGSALPGTLTEQWMDAVGDTLYNLYGSTEVGQAAIATPDEMRTAPGTAGRPPPGTTVRLLDDRDQEVEPGEAGRIYVGSNLQFSGYTGGGTKRVVDGLMSTGDVGYVDAHGLLHVTGREDDMIVSGGENVFPAEVEDVLRSHPRVDDAAAVGVPDADFGQRLAAYVVPATTAGDLDLSELRELVRTTLSRHKVPRSIEVVEEIPRNATGKVLRRELG